MAVEPAGIPEHIAGAAAVAAARGQAAARDDASSAPQIDQDTGRSVEGILQVPRLGPGMQMLAGAGAGVGAGTGAGTGEGPDVLFGYSRAADGKAAVIPGKGEAACYRYSGAADDDRTSDVPLQL